MQLVSGARRGPMQLVPLFKTRKGAAACVLIVLAFPHEVLQLLGKQRAYRRALLCGENLRLANQVGIQLERNVCLHLHSFACSTILRAYPRLTQARGVITSREKTVRPPIGGLSTRRVEGKPIRPFQAGSGIDLFDRPYRW